MSDTNEPANLLPKPKRRSEAEIIQALLAGALDIADLRVSYRTQVDEIDKSGDVPKLTRTRIYLNGEQEEVILYP